MSAINLHNYEGFLLDYSEGALSTEKIQELRSFLISHPELEIDADELQLPYFSAEWVSFDAKENLKKTESDLYNATLLNYFENKLSEQERSDVEQQLNSDPLFAAELALYKKTVLVPDEHIVFDHKASLVKTEEDLFSTEAFNLVAFTENSISARERMALEKELAQSAELRKELAHLMNTQLEADLTLVFPNKEQLKKKNNVFALYSTKNVLRMAAAILLMLSFSILLSYFYGKEQEKLASGGSPFEIYKFPRHPSHVASAKGDNKGATSRPAQPALTHAPRFPKNSPSEKKQALGAPSVLREVPQLVTTPKQVDEKQNNTGIVSPPERENTGNTLRASKESKQVVDSMNTSQFYLLALEEDNEKTNDAGEEANIKKGFWQKAVTLAQQVNKLGIKSVDGVEDAPHKFRLSINNFSVEKR